MKKNDFALENIREFLPKLGRWWKENRVCGYYWVGVGVLCVLLAGCGQSGPLYLPNASDSSALSD